MCCILCSSSPALFPDPDPLLSPVSCLLPPAPMLPTAELEYDLPPGAIATHPATPRESAKLMVVSRVTGEIVEHTTVRELPRFLRPGDCLVLNTTRVLPARLEGNREDTGGKVGGLYLRSAGHDDWEVAAPHMQERPRAWVLLMQGKSLRAGVRVRFGDLILHLIAKYAPEAGAWLAAPVNIRLDESDLDVLERIGLTPLPPYILKARKAAEELATGEGQHNITPQEQDSIDRERYQTVYAAHNNNDSQTTSLTSGTDPTVGSVAAPTAGLHLTPPLLAELTSRGVVRADVTLHVGTGTFKTVETPFVEQHPMHTETCRMSHVCYNYIQATRAAKARVICVGTTSARTIESFARADHQHLFAQSPVTTDPSPDPTLDTNLLITPGYPLAWIDGLLTNFHLPRSTLLALVGAMLPGGVPQLKSLYAQALEHKYRFFSYGDAMLLLP